MSSSIFVTGGSGFIGRSLVIALGREGHRVFALSRNPCDLRGRGITEVHGDVCRPETFSHMLTECDCLFHCAGFVSFRERDYEEAYRVNVGGTANVLEAAYRSGVRKVVYLSACAVLGTTRNPGILIDENCNPPIKKKNIYAHTKLLAEEEVKKYVKKGLDVSIANIATVYGAGDRKLNSGSVIKSVYEGRMKFVPPGGTSFTTVDDLVSGLMLLRERGRAGERYIFSNENLTYAELAGRIAKVLGVSGPACILPRSLSLPAFLVALLMEKVSGIAGDRVSLITGQIIKESFEFKYFDSIKSRKELGWTPSQSLEEAVRRAFSFYRENHLLN